MSQDRTKLLVHFRRLYGVLAKAMREGPDGTLEGNFGTEHPTFIHYANAFFLVGAMAYLEGSNGVYSWNLPSILHSTYDSYIRSLPSEHGFRSIGASQSKLDALVCIRNAVIHNNADLSCNNDKKCIDKVQAACIPGVSLNGTMVVLGYDFLEATRILTLSVRYYHGEK